MTDDAELDDRSPNAASLALVAVLVLLVAGLILFWRSGRHREPVDAPLTVDMPFAIGDSLKMPSGPCDVAVLGVAASGAVIGVPCNGRDPTEIARDALRVEGFNRSPKRGPEPGDVVLWRTHAGYIRSVVIAPEPGSRARVRPLGTPTAAEQIVILGDLTRVQAASQPNSVLFVPLTQDMPLASGDVLWDPKSPAPIQLDDPSSAEFQSRRSTLRAQVVRVRDALAVGSVVLLRDAGKWLRRKVLADDDGSLRVAPDTGGAEELRAKKDVLLLRPAAR